jgi:hypothetical protein
MKRGETMSKSIITQDGNIVNYGNLVAVYIEDDLDDEKSSRNEV